MNKILTDNEFIDSRFKILQKNLELSRNQLQKQSEKSLELRKKIEQLHKHTNEEVFSKAKLAEIRESEKKEFKIIADDLKSFRNQKPPVELIKRWHEKKVVNGALRKGTFPATFLDSFKANPAYVMWVAEHSGNVLTPPAWGCSPEKSYPDVNCNINLAEINIKGHSQGLGGDWGILAYASPAPITADLFFLYFPQTNGNLYVTPSVDIQGTIYAWAHDHWYTSTDAIINLSVQCNIFQHYFDYGSPLAIVDEHRGDSQAAYWVANTFQPLCSSTVEANTPVFIHVVVSLLTIGHSDHAVVDADFFGGADKFIRVPKIDVSLLPF